MFRIVCKIFMAFAVCFTQSTLFGVDSGALYKKLMATRNHLAHLTKTHVPFVLGGAVGGVQFGFLLGKEAGYDPLKTAAIGAGLGGLSAALLSFYLERDRAKQEQFRRLRDQYQKDYQKDSEEYCFYEYKRRLAWCVYHNDCFAGEFYFRDEDPAPVQLIRKLFEKIDSFTTKSANEDYRETESFFSAFENYQSFKDSTIIKLAKKYAQNDLDYNAAILKATQEKNLANRNAQLLLSISRVPIGKVLEAAHKISNESAQIIKEKTKDKLVNDRKFEIAYLLSTAHLKDVLRCENFKERDFILGRHKEKISQGLFSGWHHEYIPNLDPVLQQEMREILLELHICVNDTQSGNKLIFNKNQQKEDYINLDNSTKSAAFKGTILCMINSIRTLHDEQLQTEIDALLKTKDANNPRFDEILQLLLTKPLK